MFNSSSVSVDIVIPTRGRGSLIDITIASIRQSKHTNFNLWIADQSDDDNTEVAVAPHVEADPRVHYIRTAPRGASIGRNVGVMAGSAPYILFTDDDCRVEPDWVDQMLIEMVQNDASMVFGRVIPDESFKPAIPPGAKQVHADALPIAIKDVPHRQVFEGNRFNLGFGHGANMGARRDWYEKVDGFDGPLGAGAALGGWEERDLGYRVLARGGRIVYTPYAMVHHRHWRDWPSTYRAFCNYALSTGAAVNKYVRCGDVASIGLVVQWSLQQGVRQVLSGIFKWQSWQKIQVGLSQVVYPWVGLVKAMRYPINRQQVLYQSN